MRGTVTPFCLRQNLTKFCKMYKKFKNCKLKFRMKKKLCVELEMGLARDSDTILFAAECHTTGSCYSAACVLIPKNIDTASRVIIRAHYGVSTQTLCKLKNIHIQPIM